MTDDSTRLPPALLTRFTLFLRRNVDGEIEVADLQGLFQFVMEHEEKYPFLRGMVKLNEEAILDHFERTGEPPAGIKMIRTTTREGDNVTKVEIFHPPTTQQPDEE